MRSVLDILTTPGYVSLIEGPPGIGKTFLALKACSLKDKCTYVSYADPESSLREKMKVVAPEYSGNLKVISAMTGSLESVYSEIASALSDDQLVVIDTLDAMFFGIKDESSIRPFLQLLYGSVKQKSASMVLIAEGLNPAADHVRFVSDAIISLNFESVLGQNVRALRVIKDRDHPVEQPLHYVTLKDQLRIFDPFYMLSRPKIEKMKKPVYRPWGTEIDTIKYIGNRVLTMLDYNVDEVVASLYRKIVVADYIKRGYKVNYVIGPNENMKSFLEDIKALLGNTENLRIIKLNAKDYDYKADRVPHTQKVYEPNTVNAINLLADEDFAVKDPVEYEIYVRDQVKRDLEFNRVTTLMGYSDQEAMKVQLKYANLVRKMTVVDGFVFWRSVRPLGPLFSLNVRLDKGETEFIEMI
jgi:KaiC/GvpD/RAD55 family RecA-like ATPase